MNQLKAKHTDIVKREAARLGFDFCGISIAGFLEEEAKQLEQWLNSNYHGKMAYMANHFDKRLDPTKLVPGAKSVISLMINYYPSNQQLHNDAPKISKYAYGNDYHEVIKEKLKQLIETLRNEIGGIEGRAFVDSAPVLDKAWAKNQEWAGWAKIPTSLTRKMGPFFLLQN